MPFDPRSFLRRRSGAQDFATVDDLVAALRNQLETKDAGSTAADTIRGELAGAESRGRATLLRDPPTGSRKFQAGFFAGHLHAHLIRTIGTLRWEFVLPTAAYAASLVNPQAARYLLEPPLNILRAHSYACLRAAERGDLPFDIELATFRWLADQHSIPVTPDLVGQFEDSRLRRLDLHDAFQSERTMDPTAAATSRLARRMRAVIVGVERQTALIDPDSPEADRWRGVMAGLQLVSRTGLLVAATEDWTSQPYRGGLLGGHLLASLIRGDRIPGETLRLICYRYGAALSSPNGRALLAGAPPTSALKAHALGMHAVTQRAGSAIDEELEVALLNWLAGQLDVPLTAALLGDRKRYVARSKAPE